MASERRKVGSGEGCEGEVRKGVGCEGGVTDREGIRSSKGWGRDKEE